MAFRENVPRKPVGSNRAEPHHADQRPSAISGSVSGLEKRVYLGLREVHPIEDSDVRNTGKIGVVERLQSRKFKRAQGLRELNYV